MAQISEPEKMELESLIDAAGLAAVLRALSEVCAEKSEHVLTTWQDNPLAKEWTKAMRACDAAAAKVDRLGVP